MTVKSDQLTRHIQ